MELAKLVYAFIMAVLLTFGLNSASFAFHNGGVGGCEGCHTMHNSLNGAAIATGMPQYEAGPYLLRAQDQSSTCLNCHNSADIVPNGHYVSTDSSRIGPGQPPVQMTPGGDFAWLKKTYTWTPSAGAPLETSKGERHGHNIIAADYAYDADGTHTYAPGGDVFNYPAAKLHCTSCHDPHGRYRLSADNGVFSTTGKPIYSTSSYGALPTSSAAVGSYRLLAGAGYQPKSLTGSYSFLFSPPIAVAPTTYNRTETSSTDQALVAYGKGMSLFCANCHALMHSTFGGIVHAADQNLGTYIAPIYNSYKMSGDVTNTDTTISYNTLVPFSRDNIYSLATLSNWVNKANGPLSTDRIQCISCHRAHASGFDSMTRYGLGSTFMTVADTNGDPVWPDPVLHPVEAQGRTQAETQAAYYGRPATVFAAFQRVLCNKCHAKD